MEFKTEKNVGKLSCNTLKPQSRKRMQPMSLAPSPFEPIWCYRWRISLSSSIGSMIRECIARRRDSNSVYRGERLRGRSLPPSKLLCRYLESKANLVRRIDPQLYTTRRYDIVVPLPPYFPRWKEGVKDCIHYRSFVLKAKLGHVYLLFVRFLSGLDLSSLTFFCFLPSICTK